MRGLLLILWLVSTSCSNPKSPWENLLDEELSKWDTYLSYRHRLDYSGEIPKNAEGHNVQSIGMNPEGYEIFKVTDQDGVPILKISGEIYGSLISKKEYANYHLRLKMRWGDKKWTPRKEKLKDSGILYHSIGAPGAEYWRTWMLSQEFQIMEGHMGDYWNQATSAIDIRSFIPEYIMNPVADSQQPFISLGKGEKAGGFCLRSANYENPVGSWNALELICFNGQSLHIVNGEVVMVLKNSRYVVEGKSIPLISGKIQLQSEAAEVYFKEIQIRDLDSFPENYSHYF